MAAGYHYDGTRISEAWQLSPAELSPDDESSVGMAPNGDAFVAWRRQGLWPFGDSIIGRRFDSTTATWGDEFKINACACAETHRPRVVSDGADGFAVVWEGDFDFDAAVFGQHFDSDDQPTGFP